MMIDFVVFDYHIIFQDASILQFYDGLVRRDSVFCRLEAPNLEAAIFKIHDPIIDGNNPIFRSENIIDRNFTR
jgi:hypothetical protein